MSNNPKMTEIIRLLCADSPVSPTKLLMSPPHAARHSSGASPTISTWPCLNEVTEISFWSSSSICNPALNFPSSFCPVLD